MGEISITVEEYKRLLEAEIRINVFSDFVKKEKYNISREECGHYLGFEVEDAGED